MLNMTEDELHRAALIIGTALGETQPKPIEQIEQIEHRLRHLGVEWTQAMLNETLAVKGPGWARTVPAAAEC